MAICFRWSRISRVPRFVPHLDLRFYLVTFFIFRSIPVGEGAGFDAAFLPSDGDSDSLVGSLFRIFFSVSLSPDRQISDGTGRQQYGYGNKENCFCQPSYRCPLPSSDYSPSQLDVRIVTPSRGRYCRPGYTYCCWNGNNRCGRRSLMDYFSQNTVSRSVGQAPYGAYPWQTLILTKSNVFVGSGALIDPQYVVTVAHKLIQFSGSNALKVRLGEWDTLANGKEAYPAIERDISIVSVHPQFDQDGLQYDLAVLKLSVPVTISDATPHINTICMPQPRDSFIGDRCWVSGWGKSEYGPEGGYQSVQKEVDVTILSPPECERLLRQTRLGPFYRFDAYNFLCAGGERDKDACSGDGGAPLVCEKTQGQFYLAGLVAWGIGCGNPQIPGVYVNICSFVSWINSQISEKSEVY